MNVKRYVQISSFIALLGSANLYLSSIHTNSTYFSPDDDTLQVLENLIDSSKKNIIVAVYNFTSKELASALIKAKKRGIHINVVVDTSSEKYNTLEYMQSRGVDVSVYKKDGSLMHHKFAVIDGKVLLTGSMNWTHSGLNRNQENILVIHDKEICQRYKNQFLVLKSRCS